MMDASEMAAFLLQQEGRVVGNTNPQQAQGKGGNIVVKAVGGVLYYSMYYSLVAGKKIVKVVLGDDDDDDYDNYDNEDEEFWKQQEGGDDAFGDCDDKDATEGDEGKKFRANTLIINVPMTRSAIQLLEQEINVYKPESLQGDTPMILDRNEWSQWTAKVLAKAPSTTASSSLSNILMKDKEFLLQILMCMGIAQTFQRENANDLIVLFPSSLIPKEGSSQQQQKGIDGIPDSLQAPIALWDIEKSQKILERQIDAWTKQALACEKKALQLKQRGQKELAIGQMKKRKALLNQIAMEQEKSLSLDKTKTTIESAQCNKMVDNVQDELLSEMDNQQELNDAFMATTKLALGGSVDDDELLKELEGLNLDDLNTEMEGFEDALQLPTAKPLTGNASTSVPGSQKTQPVIVEAVAKEPEAA
ncbi:MAG: hypothetical protein SGARI_002406 [Bacillariaceae sp.]